MNRHADRQRKVAGRAIVTAVAALAMVGGIQAVAGTASAARLTPAAVTSQTTRSTAPKWMHLINLHSAYAHALAHVKLGKIAGITYRLGYQQKAAATAQPAAATACTEPNCAMSYHNGPVEHTAHIYLLLWGPTWATDSGEIASATYLEDFYAGLGVQPQDSWSLTTAQYTDSTGSPTFSGSQFEGVFTDTSTPPTGTTQAQLTAETDAFASSNGLTTNPQDDQVVVATQSGTCPQGFAGGFTGAVCANPGSYCAYHAEDSTSGVTFTNLPYLLDAGTDCGEGFINTPGTDDGFSIVGGHEYAETITDPYPRSGWIDPSDRFGGEIGDKCAWAGKLWGQNPPDPAGNVTLSTGTFAMQSLWSNAANACVLASGELFITNPGNQSTADGSPVSLQIRASSAIGATVTYTATGLPAGLSINSSTGLISGTPTAAGTSSVTVQVSDTTGASESASFTWTITGTVSVTNPGNQTTAEGAQVNVQISASDTAGLTLSYNATGLPAGLSINSATGLITGTPTTGGTSTVTVTATDTLNDTGSASFTWTITPPAVAVGAEGTNGALFVLAPQLGAGWHTEGGKIVGPPAVAAAPNPDGASPAAPLFIATGTSKLLYIRSLTAGWQQVGPVTASCLGSPAAVISGGQLTVACEGTNRALYYNTTAVPASGLPTFTSGWKSLGGTLTAGPAVAPVGGTLTFFVRGTTGHVYTRTLATRFAATPWACTGSPAAALQAATGITVFACQGTNHQLYEATSSGTGWTGAVALGGSLIGGPAIGATTGSIELFGEGITHAVYVRTTATGFTSIGGKVAGGVGAAALN